MYICSKCAFIKQNENYLKKRSKDGSVIFIKRNFWLQIKKIINQTIAWKNYLNISFDAWNAPYGQLPSEGKRLVIDVVSQNRLNTTKNQESVLGS